ncbi:MAG TPA: outer membrane protein assembly factor BamC [Burkholderiales bacterium]|nr:outer membrane protein assembly factor BamC [Burkholderiales bacterium]
MKLSYLRFAAAVSLIATLTAGCSVPKIESDKVDYKSAGQTPPLEVPPDLVKPAADDRFAIPGAQNAGAAPAAPYATMAKGDDGTDVLMVNDPFDRAWRRVGLALDRSGITVEDRDREKGIYRVHYDDPDAQDKSTGFFSKLFGKKKTDADLQHQILVKEVATKSRVSVLGKDGNVEKSETAGHLLAKLYEQLK